MLASLMGWSLPSMRLKRQGVSTTKICSVLLQRWAGMPPCESLWQLSRRWILSARVSRSYLYAPRSTYRRERSPSEEEGIPGQADDGRWDRERGCVVDFVHLSRVQLVLVRVLHAQHGVLVCVSQKRLSLCTD